jgi:uncharacterized protein with gpF-like domain
MHKIATKLHFNEKKRKKNSLTYLRGLLDFHEGKHSKAVSRFSTIVDDNHEAAYMAIICSMKMNSHDEAGLFLEKYSSHVSRWTESDEKEFAIKRVKKLREVLEAGRVFG